MAENNVIERKHKSPWIVILKRFSGNKMGVIGTVLIICLIFVAILAPLLEPYSFKEQNMERINDPPSASHLLGTDEYGRDMLSRVIRGARISFVVGVLSVAISVIIGIVIGSIAGFYGGVIDLIFDNHRRSNLVDAGDLNRTFVSGRHRSGFGKRRCRNRIILLGSICSFSSRANPLFKECRLYRGYKIDGCQ